MQGFNVWDRAGYDMHGLPTENAVQKKLGIRDKLEIEKYGVEKFIKDNSGEYKKTELFNNLPKKVMWQTFQVVMEYLENSLRVAYDREGYVVYIWNPEFVKRFKNRPELKWNAK